MVKRLSFKSTIVVALLIVSCSKESSSPSQPAPVQPEPIIYIPKGSNMNAPVLLMDSTWICTLVGYPSLRFGSDGSFDTGTWRMRQPDSIRAMTLFTQDWRIVTVSADTLRLVNVGNFVSIYHH